MRRDAIEITAEMICAAAPHGAVKIDIAGTARAARTSEETVRRVLREGATTGPAVARVRRILGLLTSAPAEQG